jgi:hypothetical protein
MAHYSPALSPARVPSARLTTGRGLLWTRGLAFVFGFFSQFNVLIGGSGEGAAATGGYGYRATDCLCLIAIALLAIGALAPRRLVTLTVFGLALAVIAVLRVLEPTFGSDPRTVIVALHYLGYAFAGLYVATLLNEPASREGFCWGLIAGLLATIPIFVLQDAGQTALLVGLGLIPGYYEVLHLDVGEALRYSGLWSHPNEAGHVAALAAPAAAYLYLVRRRLLPMLLVALALLATFYYTQSRGGLIVGGAVLAIPLFFGRERRINFFRLLLVGVCLSLAMQLVSQLDFVSSRFEDAGTEGNFAERLNSTWVGLELVLTHPFGLSLLEFHSLMAAVTGGIVSPHNGFIVFAAIFGWLPFAVLIAALLSCFSVRADADALFAFMSFGVSLSCLFEEVAYSYPFALAISIIIGRAFLKTKIGSESVKRSSRVLKRPAGFGGDNLRPGGR